MIYEEEASEDELARADHLIYVTLKYTRSCDVILNIIKRLIAAFDKSILEGFTYAKSIHKISDIPENEIVRSEEFPNILNKRGVKKYFDLYKLMRKVYNAPYDKREEFRKHVTLISKFDKGVIEEVDVPRLMEFFKMTKEFDHVVNEFTKK